MEESQLKERAQILMDLMNDKAYVPMKAKEIAILLNLPKSQRDELKEVLDYLVAEGKVGLSKKGKYGKPETFSVNGFFPGIPRDSVLLPWREWTVTCLSPRTAPVRP